MLRLRWLVFTDRWGRTRPQGHSSSRSQELVRLQVVVPRGGRSTEGRGRPEQHPRGPGSKRSRRRRISMLGGQLSLHPQGCRTLWTHPVRMHE